MLRQTVPTATGKAWSLTVDSMISCWHH